METTRTLQQRSACGDVDSTFRLGYRLAFGRSRPRPTRWAQVAEYWQRAATAGHARAQFYLATCYDFGRGVAIDHAMAGWYRRAAGQGVEAAAYNLGLCLRDESERENSQGAAASVGAAATAGDVEAARDLGVLLHEGLGGPRRRCRSSLVVPASGAQGDAKADNLGLSYLAGDGVRPSLRWGRFWLKCAAAGGNPRARTRLRQLAAELAIAPDAAQRSSSGSS